MIRIAQRYQGEEELDDIKKAQELGERHKAALTARGVSLIRLDIGRPDARPPQETMERFWQYTKDGDLGYSRMGGMEKTLQYLAQSASLPVPITPKNIFMGDSGCHVINDVVCLLCDPGDNIIMPDPHWAVYDLHALNASAEARPVPYWTGGRLDVERIIGAIDARTRAIIINSPENPTGKMIGGHDLAALAQALAGKDVAVIEDLVYRDLAYAGTQESITQYLPEQTIVIDSYSKKCAVPGFRIGVVYAPEPVIRALPRIDRAASGAPSTVSQYMLWALHETGQVPLQGLHAAMRERRDVVQQELRRMASYGWSSGPLEGAFYAFPDIGNDARPFVRELLTRTGVNIVAGDSFGPAGAHHARISYGSADVPTLREAFDRIRWFYEGD